MRTLNLGFLFWLAALFILIFGMDVVWWQAFLVLLLSQVELKFQWS